MQIDDVKLRALAEFAAGAGHEINNPVATIVGYAQQLLAGETDPDCRHALATIGAQAYRIRDMIGDVMLFARPPQPRPQDLDLAFVIHEIVSKLADEALAAAVNIHVQAEGLIPILADPVQLRIVISSLLRNSFEALGQGGNVMISASTIEELGKSTVRFSVADDGPGLSDTEREHLFDPFYSGRQAGRGLGFGLSKVWRIVTLHEGRIEVDLPAAGGVAFAIHWPTPA
jgi:signal transduction histidine kinase